MRPALASLLLLTATATATAQWTLQQSNTTADLRGIHALPNGIAWASGTHGTVLHTTDNGTTWLLCTTPPAAEALDFRGIQAFDANTAVVMSSGKGDLSRLYKTTDACKTWKLIFTNPDPEGFWDAVQFDHSKPAVRGLANKCFGVVIGDSIRGAFPMFLTFDCGNKWERQLRRSALAEPGEGLFAASNSSLIVQGPDRRSFVTGSTTPHVITFGFGFPGCLTPQQEDAEANVAPGALRFTPMQGSWHSSLLPLIGKSAPSVGAFSFAEDHNTTVIVGGDYTKPEDRKDTAWSFPIELRKDEYRVGFAPAITPPHGFRSAVAYFAPQKTWITEGPNGTDVSRDDGRNWQPVNPQSEDSQHWNALSLPYVVGPHGRIGLLRPEALTPLTPH